MEDQVFDIVLFSPSGGISLEDAWVLSPKQRDKIIKRINKYREDMSPTQTPNMM